ncbi:MAG: SIMPL domain-containing protein [Dehalococcoidia bacterium]
MQRSVRWGALVAASIGILLAGSACDESNQGDTYVNASGETTGILVAGSGRASAPPDTGFVTVGVQVTAVTVEKAREDAAKAAAAVIAAVKQNGVDAKDIQTTNFSISPNFVYPRDGGEPTITGYVVVNTLDVKVRKLDALSAVIDGAAVAAGDAARVQGVRFDIEDSAALYEKAREQAMIDAKKKGEQLAKLGGVKLGVPLAISEVQLENPLIAEARTGIAGAAFKDATPIEAGTTAITVNLTVRWAIAE